MKTRHFHFVGGMVLCAGFWLTGSAARVQDPVAPSDTVPRVQQHSRQEPPSEGPALPNADKKILEENDKDIKKKVDRLFELATELKAEVDKTDSSKVLSLNLLKKAEEIEKLAREIKSRSKG